MEGEESPHLDCAIYLVSGMIVQAGGSAEAVAEAIDQRPDACRIVVHLNGGVGTADGEDPHAHWLLLAIQRAIENRDSACIQDRSSVSLPGNRQCRKGMEVRFTKWIAEFFQLLSDNFENAKEGLSFLGTVRPGTEPIEEEV